MKSGAYTLETDESGAYTQEANEEWSVHTRS